MRWLTPVWATVAVVAVSCAARADSITMRGSSIALGDCYIQAITDGRVYYTDQRGRRQWRELRKIASLAFDDLPRLDEAERALGRGEADIGLRLLLRTLLDAEAELRRIWLRVRIIREHERRGEYVQAASHLASLYMLSEQATWRDLEPLGDPNRPALPALAEAMDRLMRAKRAVEEPTLRGSVDRMIEAIRPIYEEAASQYDGDPIDPERTISGFLISDIRADRMPRPPSREESDEPEASGEVPPAADRSRLDDDDQPDVVPEADSPDGIDALLEAGRSAEALELCERIARDPDGRSLGRFLHQYGRALAAEHRPKDAAVMYMRCALLYDASPFAGPSLIEAARIYAEVFDDARAARRIVRRALQWAARYVNRVVEDHARALLAGLEGEGE